jgi:hypothetical protein
MRLQGSNGDNGKPNLQDLLKDGQPNSVSSAHFGCNVMFGVNLSIDEGDFVHYDVSTKEEEIVQEQRQRHISADLQGCGSYKASHESMPTWIEPIPYKERHHIYPQFSKF